MSRVPRNGSGNALHYHCSEERLLVGKAGIDGWLPGARKPGDLIHTGAGEPAFENRARRAASRMRDSTSPASSRGGRPVRTARPLPRLLGGVISPSIERSFTFSRLFR